VNNHSEHGFVIDREELEELIGPSLAPPEPDRQRVIDTLETILTNHSVTALGRIERREVVQHDSQ
jgi:hypothetical protein